MRLPGRLARLLTQGREMERQIAARDRALFAGVDAQLEQHFLTPGQRLSPPGVGNVMLLMVCLTLGLAGVMGTATDVAAARAARLPPPFSWAAARSWRCG